MEEFAAANPYYACSYDKDRRATTSWRSSAPRPRRSPARSTRSPVRRRRYSSGTVSAPRGAGRQVDLDRQTSKIVKAINGLGADIVSLEELENPNKLRKGVVNGPLNPNANLADQGFGTPIAWRDETINYLVDQAQHRRRRRRLVLRGLAGGVDRRHRRQPHVRHHATRTARPIQPPQTNGTCSYASGQDVIRSGFLYKKATVVPGRSRPTSTSRTARPPCRRRSTTPVSRWPSSSSRSVTRTPTGSRSSSTTSRARATATRQRPAATPTAPTAV